MGRAESDTPEWAVSDNVRVPRTRRQHESALRADTVRVNKAFKELERLYLLRLKHMTEAHHDGVYLREIADLCGYETAQAVWNHLGKYTSPNGRPHLEVQLLRAVPERTPGLGHPGTNGIPTDGPWSVQ